MDKIVVKASKPQEHARDICNKIYNLRPNEYEIEGGSEERATIIFHCVEKIQDSKVFITTDEGAFTGFLFMYPALNEGKMHTQMHTLSTRFVFANTKMHTQTHT